MQKEILINDTYLPYVENKDRYLVLYGSAGSGKSVFAAQKLIIRLTTELHHRFLVVRKVANTIRSSAFQLILDVIAEFGIREHFTVNKTEMKITYTRNGNEIWFGGLDDVEKLKSITGITSVWIEEATELKADDFDQIDLRLRGETPHYKQIILSFNPIDERHWLKERFFDNDVDGCSILKTTYRDNEFLDEEYKRTLELKAKVNPNYYRIYVLGQWGREDTEKPFIYNFNRDKHTGKVARVDKELRFSTDFNFNPFVTIVGQAWFDKDGHHIRILKEHAMVNKGVLDKIELIKNSYTQKDLATCLWTGDATQRKRTVEQNIVNGKNLHAWEQIDRAFNLRRRLQVPNVNPNVSTSRDVCNFIFALHPDIIIDEGCTLLINEILYTEADDEGKINKKNRNKESQKADALDCLRYYFNTWCPDIMQRPEKYGIR